MELRVLDETLAIARCAGDDPVPAWVAGRDFLAVVRTRRELSIVCRDDAIPATHAEVERGFRCFAVSGTVDVGFAGVVAAVAQPLAAAAISIFNISTYDTDHVLVREDRVEAAKDALRAAGHVVRDERPTPAE